MLGHKEMLHDYSKGQVGIFGYVCAIVCVFVYLHNETNLSNHYKTLNSHFSSSFSPFFLSLTLLFLSSSVPLLLPSFLSSPYFFLEHLLMLNLDSSVYWLRFQVFSVPGALCVPTSNYNPLKAYWQIESQESLTQRPRLSQDYISFKMTITSHFFITTPYT